MVPIASLALKLEVESLWGQLKGSFRKCMLKDRSSSLLCSLQYFLRNNEPGCQALFFFRCSWRSLSPCALASQADEVRTVFQDFILRLWRIPLQWCHVLTRSFVMGFGSLQSIREQKLFMVSQLQLGYGWLPLGIYCVPSLGVIISTTRMTFDQTE